MNPGEIRYLVHEIKDNIYEYFNKRFDSKLIVNDDQGISYYPLILSNDIYFKKLFESYFDEIIYTDFVVDVFHYSKVNKYDNLFHSGKLTLIDKSLDSLNLDDLFKIFDSKKVKDKLKKFIDKNIDLLVAFSIYIKFESFLKNKVKFYHHEFKSFSIVAIFNYKLQDLF